MTRKGAANRSNAIPRLEPSSPQETHHSRSEAQESQVRGTTHRFHHDGSSREWDAEFKLKIIENIKVESIFLV